MSTTSRIPATTPRTPTASPPAPVAPPKAEAPAPVDQLEAAGRPWAVISIEAHGETIDGRFRIHTGEFGHRAVEAVIAAIAQGTRDATSRATTAVTDGIRNATRAVDRTVENATEAVGAKAAKATGSELVGKATTKVAKAYAWPTRAAIGLVGKTLDAAGSLLAGRPLLDKE